MHYPAWIEIGAAETRECQLADVSLHGARLIVQSPADLPDSFTLRLSQDGTTRRKCQVVWRSQSELGLEFRKEPKPKAAKTSRPKTP